MPGQQSFGPLHHNMQGQEPVEMTVDEFETIRLIDLEGLSQQECADQMQVGRTTAQAIYNRARTKLAQCLVNGQALFIGGGHYMLSGGEGKGCGCKRRYRQGRHCNNGRNNGRNSAHENETDLSET